MGYEVDYSAGERTGCSSKLVIADRIFYVKHFNTGASRFFSGDQKGIIQKEISKAEFELWVNILADDQLKRRKFKENLLGKKILSLNIFPPCLFCSDIQDYCAHR